MGTMTSRERTRFVGFLLMAFRNRPVRPDAQM